jgi:hypothetical protein
MTWKSLSASFVGMALVPLAFKRWSMQLMRGHRLQT